MSTDSPGSPTALNRGPQLQACDLNVCEARCCYDGVYLDPGEEDRLRALVAEAPKAFPGVPEEMVVDGSWGDGRIQGRKTATKPHAYRSPEFPAHFNRTRCVFCRDDHRCSLQALAIERGEHPWAYKPTGCWLFPMHEEGGRLHPPPRAGEPDPLAWGQNYPGFASYVPCGQDQPEGLPWQEALAAEVAYWAQRNGKPG